MSLDTSMLTIVLIAIFTIAGCSECVNAITGSQAKRRTSSQCKILHKTAKSRFKATGNCHGKRGTLELTSNPPSKVVSLKENVGRPMRDMMSNTSFELTKIHKHKKPTLTKSIRKV